MVNRCPRDGTDLDDPTNVYTDPTGRRDCRACRRRRARDYRARNGPLSTDIDDVVVYRIVGGDRTLRPTRAERLAAITELSRLGLNDNQIAARLGVTDRTVLRARQRLGLPPVPQYRNRYPSDERLATVATLYRAGLNDREIADRLGISDRAVFRDRRRLNLPANPRRHRSRWAA